MANIDTAIFTINEATQKIEQSVSLSQLQSGIELDIRDVHGMLVRLDNILRIVKRRMDDMGTSLAGEHEHVSEAERFAQELMEKMGEKDLINERLDATIEGLEKRNAGLKANIADNKAELMTWLSQCPEIAEDDE